jgi:hypothetical protein
LKWSISWAFILVIGRDKLVGAHRTWIMATGRARYCDGKKMAKQWIGRTGDMMGRPCVLSPPTSAVVVGGRIETTLAGKSTLMSLVGEVLGNFDGYAAPAKVKMFLQTQNQSAGQATPEELDLPNAQDQGRGRRHPPPPGVHSPGRQLARIAT